MIRLENVKKTYTTGNVDTEALRGVSLTIKEKDYAAVMGTSGCGKSTLLNIIGCMDCISEGSYFFNDLPVHKMSVKQMHRFRKGHISFVFQNFALLNQYTVYENVELPLIAQGFSSKKRKEIVLNTLEEVGILELREKLPVHISGGQQQRTAIARALVSDHELILADEPTGALDRKTSEDIMELFDRINHGGKTIILVTHDQKVAEHAKRIIRMEDGICFET